MSYAIAIPLLAAQTADGSAGLKFDDGGGYGLNFPTNKPDWSWADEITFVLSLVAINGAPTTWSVGAKLQFLQPHTYNFQFQRPVWFDVQPEQIDNCVVEKCGFYAGAHTAPLDGSFGVIADNTDTAPSAAAPITVQRTVKNFGQSARVVLNPTHTGGTSPRFGLSVTAILKAN
jgi:hypothetical protein